MGEVESATALSTMALIIRESVGNEVEAGISGIQERLSEAFDAKIEQLQHDMLQEMRAMRDCMMTKEVELNTLKNSLCTAAPGELHFRASGKRASFKYRKTPLPSPAASDTSWESAEDWRPLVSKL